MLWLARLGISLFNRLLPTLPALMPDGNAVAQFCRNLRKRLVQNTCALRAADD
ncbi:hypothetical protein D3C76_1605540 [compost metagenome]